MHAAATPARQPELPVYDRTTCRRSAEHRKLDDGEHREYGLDINSGAIANPTMPKLYVLLRATVDVVVHL